MAENEDDDDEEVTDPAEYHVHDSGGNHDIGAKDDEQDDGLVMTNVPPACMLLADPLGER